ncbi:MAG: hypothetical protein ACLFVW_06600 [Phycisphaerae bacterium]
MFDIRLLITAFMTALAAGCCCQQPGEVLGSQATLPADGDSAAYLDRLSSEREVSENDAARGMLLLLDIDDSGWTFDRRVEELRKRDVVPAHWEMDAHRPVTRGRLARMAYSVCDLRGGIINEIAGPTPRYCLREMVFVDMMSPGSVHGRVGGMETVALLSRADVYIREGELPDYVSAAGSD